MQHERLYIEIKKHFSFRVFNKPTGLFSSRGQVKFDLKSPASWSCSYFLTEIETLKNMWGESGLFEKEDTACN